VKLEDYDLGVAHKKNVEQLRGIPSVDLTRIAHEKNAHVWYMGPFVTL